MTDEHTTQTDAAAAEHTDIEEPQAAARTDELTDDELTDEDLEQAVGGGGPHIDPWG